MKFTKRLTAMVLAGSIGAVLFVATRPEAAVVQNNTTPLHEFMPATSVMYFSWDGLDEHQAAISKTAAWKSLVDSGLAESGQKLAEFAIAQSMPPDMAKKATGLVQSLIRKGFAMSLSMDPGGPPVPTAVLVVRNAGNMATEIQQLMEQARVPADIERNTVENREVRSFVIPDTPGLQMAWWNEANNLVISAGMEPTTTALNVITDRAPNLKDNRVYQQYSKDGDFEVSSLAFLDIGTVRQMFGGMPIPDMGGEITVNDVAKQLGLDQVGAVVSRSGYQGEASWSETILEAPQPYQGILGLLKSEEFSISDLPPLPADTSGFFALSKKPADVADTLVETAMRFAKLAPTERDREQVEGMTQMIASDPILKEITASVGDLMCVYGGSGSSLIGLNFGIAIEVDDAARLRTAVNRIIDMASSQMNPEEVEIVRMAKYGRELISVSVMGGVISPTICIDKDWATIGLNAQTITAGLMRADGKLKSWKPSADYEKAMAALPDKYSSIAVSDPKTAVYGLASAAPMLLGFAQAGARQQMGPGLTLPVTAADLPPAELVADPLFPNVSVCLQDEKTVRWRSRYSLPASGMPGLSSGAAVPVLVALLLPAVQQAREAARRTQSKNNIKEIMLAMHNYHDVYAKFPAPTAENPKLKKPEERLSWFYSILPFVEQAVLYEQFDKKQGWNVGPNKQMSEVAIPTFLHPNNPNSQSDDGVPAANYVGIAGLGERGPFLKAFEKGAGMFGYGRQTRMRDITDGTSNTIAVSEVRDKVGPWAQGGLSTIRPFTKEPYINGPDGIGSYSPGGCHFGLADGSVRFISENIDPKVLEALTTIQGREVVPQF